MAKVTKTNTSGAGYKARIRKYCKLVKMPTKEWEFLLIFIKRQ